MRAEPYETMGRTFWLCEGEVAVANHANTREPQVYNGVSEADVPSARFGWSDVGRGAVQIAGWISVLTLIGFNFGNHQGNVETIWLITLAVLIALGLLIHATQPKLSQVRTVTAHNQPVGHQEPDWAYDQKTLSGVYEDLDERQLRALNIDPSRIAHIRGGRHHQVESHDHLAVGYNN